MKKFFVIAFCFYASVAVAQDIHFSQFFASPLTTNPANTGSFDGDYRVGGNYRGQWASVPVPYHTVAAYGDMSFHKQGPYHFYPAAGISLQHDAAGDGNLQMNKVYLSGVGYYGFDKFKTTTLAVGIQIGLVQKSIDFPKLYFGNQWNEIAFDQQLPTGEPNVAQQMIYPDVSVGASFNYGLSDMINWHAGLSVAHINQPNETFYSGATNKIGMRPQANAGATIVLNDEWLVYPSVYFASEKKASEFLLGSLISYQLETAGNKSRIYAGAFTRTSDAIIGVTGYEINNLRFFFSYDVTVSDLKTYNHSRGAGEISISYIGSFFHNNSLMDMPCPRF